MNNYYVRSETGILTAELSHKVANEIILNAQGKWRSYQTADTPKRMVFELTGDHVYHIGRGDIQIEVMLWKGYVLIPKN